MTAVVATLALMCSVAPVGDHGDWILQPAQERVAERLVGMDLPELQPGVSLERVALVRDHVQVLLRGPDGLVQVRIYAPGSADGSSRADKGQGATGATIVTGAGVLWIPPQAPPGLGDALAARLRQSESHLRWKSLIAATDPQIATAGAQLLAHRVAWRLGLREDAPAFVPVAPPMEAAWEAMRSGDQVDVRARITPLLEGSSPPTGAVSLWLASGPPRPGPCPQGAPCPVEVLLHDLEEERADPQWAAQWAEEPRVLVLGARNAAERGEPELAAALLWQALAGELPDQGAVDLATDWGWGSGRGLSRGLPASHLGAGGSGSDGTLPWLLAGALLLWGAGMLVARDELSRPALVLSTMGALAALGVGLSLSSPTAGSAPSQPDLPQPWQEVGRGTSCVLSPPAITPEGWYGQVRCGQDRVGVVIRSRPTERVHLSTGRHFVQVMPMGPSTQVAESVESWLRRLRRDLIDLEADGLSLPAPDPGAHQSRRGSVMSRIATSGRPDQHLLTGPVAVLALFCLVWLLVLGARAIRETALEDPWQTRVLLALGGVVVFVHLLAPSGMVMVYSGYAQVAELLQWEPLRYGAGANWLYGPWLAWLGSDHSVVQLANRFYGIVGWVLLVAWSARLCPRATWAVAAVTALAPILWRDHASESILVGGWMMLIAALFALSEAARTGRAAVGLLGLPCALMAAMTRPEMALALVPLGLVALLHHRPTWSRRGWGLLALAVLCGLLLAVPHGQQVLDTVDALVSVNALPGLERLRSRFFSDMWTLQGLHVAVAYGPVVLLLLLPLAWIRREDRLLVTGVFLVSLAWMAFTRVDLPEVSTPRVHAPPWTLLAVVAGLGANTLWRRLEELPSSGLRLSVRGAIIVAWLVSAGWTVPVLYQPTNADAEEELLREVQGTLPSGQICLATLDNRDPPPPGKTHRFFPYYLFEDRDVPPRLSNLSGLDEARGACPDGAYALLGMRCYMHLREEDAAGDPPEGETPIAACADFRRRWELEPILEHAVANRFDLAFPMYPSGKQLTVGLYRVGDIR